MINTPNVTSQKLYALFQRYKSRRFIFIEPGGNWGDLLIYRGAEKLANLAGIKFESMNRTNFMSAYFESDVVLYIHGGGGFNTYWSATPMHEFFKAVGSHCGIVILGPQTFLTDEVFLKKEVVDRIQDRKVKKLYMFTREMTSYRHLKDILPRDVELELDHDTALNMTDSDFSQFEIQNRYTLYAIRRDKESSDIPRCNPFLLWLDPVKSCQNFDHWVDIHAKARKIITNRIHSAIVGNILGKPVTLLPNHYHKNRSIWEYSLESRAVEWQDKLTANRIVRGMYTYRFIRRILDSYKLETFVELLYGLQQRNQDGTR